MSHLYQFCLFCSFILAIPKCFAQTNAGDTSAFKSIAAGAEYNKPASYQKLWGRNWRKDWMTVVQAPMIRLDTIEGGLSASRTNGGNETKGLRLKSASGKEYALRSINKARNDVVPRQFKHTFIEDIIQDGVSMSQPYGAFALPVMEQHAGIYHTEPRLVYVPKQPALDTLNEEFGNDLYLIEQRMSGDWSDADNLGNFNHFLGTDEVVKKCLEDNHNTADQYAFVKARLFDMLLADWDRHEDQWKWGERKEDERSLFIPIPRDRDQVFYKHNGVLIDKALVAIGNGYMQNFDFDSKDISALNKEEQNIDPFFTNGLSQEDWIRAAKELQQSLTDDVISQSVAQLPREIFANSGNEIIEKLKSRRQQLVKYAGEYYLFLARSVEITGSKKSEYFEITTNDSGETLIRIFDLENGQKGDKAIYSRAFKSSETNTIRVYGIGGEDRYSIDGDNRQINLHIIGGTGRDSLIQTGSGRIHIYDDRKNSFQISHARFHISSDSAIHAFDYFDHLPDKKGFRPLMYYDDPDRFYVGLGYGFTTHKWRRSPFATQQSIDIRYSLCQNAFSATYRALFPNVVAKRWNLFLFGNYDWVRWANFFGLGNETKLESYNKEFFRLRTMEWLGSAGINRQLGKSTVAISGFLQSVKIMADTGRYLTKVFLPLQNDAFESNHYAGGLISYSFLVLNDSIVPTKGLTLSVNAAYFGNTDRGEFFQKYFGRLQWYLPLGNKFSLAIKAAASTIVCKTGILNSPEYYEHAIIGGPETLRGFRLDRFWGQSAFYNNNELRYITNLQTHILNARVGCLVFFDDGRVWMPGEKSNTLHTAYGGGVIFSPFYQMAATITYGISSEARIFQVSLNHLF